MATDHNDFISQPKYVEIQPAFSRIIECVVTNLTHCFPDLIHSIYVYGSVAEGRAEEGRSDLDMTVIFKHELDRATKEQFATVQSVLEKNNPVISKIDFDCGLLGQVLDPNNVLSWGYWIKHHCHCVYGEDLSHHFQAFKPSKAIAVAVNGDFMQVLDKLVIQIKTSSNENKKLQLQRSAARKLIRATNILRSEQDNDWPDSLHEYRAKFNSRYPALAEDMDYLLEISIKPRSGITDFEKRVMAFAHWLSSEFNSQKA
ncbi:MULTISPECIES: nucleotidyltransferase domain-containing protein [Proteus]|uniref:Nucleotidyltransferase domain-containing protein n=1 Tax=Proteus penneri TaxID=102862 RepID=A0ABS0W7G9_9GAMM|nr:MULTISPECIES: nucleotidyltransferase domain-containing protein [Proteus]EEG83759.1 hypothetical protein PROPEN_04529 [Proteus penneri ATCC 35198]MBJ2117904.1 nucleotidyltransferase domain-containing protein [Proteus penneri]NBM13489.1 nucleotidyltransferase domain-containing protein [Proteus sp. G2670]NBM32170.1 nucleotidyltransferase domain-containing protein [Proteus sp. G2664]NBM84805.1 nucleotidyltransferase domain-containing protein [Proteus sp. G2661]